MNNRSIFNFKGFTMVEAIFFILIVAILLSSFSHTYLFFTKKQSQLLSENNVIDLAISCNEIILNSKDHSLCEQLFNDTPYSFLVTRPSSDRDDKFYSITVKNKQDDTTLITLEFSDVEQK